MNVNVEFKNCTGPFPSLPFPLRRVKASAQTALPLRGHGSGVPATNPHPWVGAKYATLHIPAPTDISVRARDIPNGDASIWPCALGLNGLLIKR